MNGERFEHVLNAASSVLGNIWSGQETVRVNIPNANPRHSTERQQLLFADRCVLELFIEYGRRLLNGISPEEAGRNRILNFFKYRQKMLASPHFPKDNPFRFILRSTSTAKNVVLLMTHSCQLRCSYCSIGKFKADTPVSVIRRLLNAIVESGQDRFHIQFFGGEPFIRFETMKKAVKMAKNMPGNTIFSFGVNTNGVNLREEMAVFCKKNNVMLDISCDGNEKTCSMSRNCASGSFSTVYSSIMRSMEILKKEEVSHRVIMVVSPQTLPYMKDNFHYIQDLGHRNIQFNYSLGIEWGERDRDMFIRNLLDLRKEVAESGTKIVNFTSFRLEPAGLNAEICCDCDGTLYRETGLSIETSFAEAKRKFLESTVPTSQYFGMGAMTHADALWQLLEIYGNDRKILKIIMNNIEFGMRIGKIRMSVMLNKDGEVWDKE